MAIYLDDVREMKLNKTPFYLPINVEDKRRSSAIFLLTPDVKSSIAMMNHPLTINKNLFTSYYLEKDINFIINESKVMVPTDSSSILESCIMEMTAKERNALPDSAFGLPEDRKYPLDTAEHVKSAIKLFGHCEEGKKSKLAKRIMVAAKRFNIEVAENTEVYKYAHEDVKKESTPLSEQVLDYDNYDEERITEEALIYTESGHNFKQFFPDFVENYVTEASGFGGTLRRLLYNERIKNQKECSIIYDRIKEGCPFIKYTYLNYKKYKSRNLFVDWAYYTESFFKNNVYKLDKGIDLYFNFLNKFLQDTRLNEFYKRKTVFIPVDAWYNGKDAVWDYTKSINPISLIYRIFRTKRDDEIKSAWKDIEFVFFSNGVYFKMKFDDFTMAKLSSFNMLINKLCLNSVQDAEFVAKDSFKVITHKIVDKIEKSGIVIDNLSGGAGSGSTKEDIAKEKNNTDFNSAAYAKKANTSKEDVDKALLVQKVQTAAEKSGDEDDAMTNLNNDVESAWMKNLIVDLQSEDGPAINKARSQRMEKAYNSFLGKKINNSKIEDLIKVNGTNKALPTDNIPIESINEEWKDVQFSTFSKSYNLESDLVNSLAALNSKTNPIVILDIIKEDTSTTEDYIETWTIKCEDINGKRFTLKLDIPKFINDRFMKLRGNLKVLNGQLLLLPIIKTDEDTCQIVSSSYNKIFVRRVNPSNGTKTTRSMSIVNKYLKKYDGNKMKIIEGDNSIVCSKYDIPIEMRDIASNYNKVIFKDGSYLCFNMDEFKDMPYQNPKDKDDPTMTPYYVNDKGKVVCSNAGNFGADIMSIIISHMGLDCFDGIKADKRLSYSEASILATGIPVIVVMAYSEGLQQAMAKAGIESEFRETRPKANESYIKFSDGYIVYPDTVTNSLLMSGLYTCNTEDYSIKDINSKNMWLDFLDNFGGRIKADGLDNFYDCMFDPITKEICNTYNLPDDYVTALGYASALLGDTKYNLHTDISGNRIRTNEIIAAYFDKVISKAYGEYRIMLKRNKKDATMSVKQSAVIDAVLMDSTCSDLSVLNPQLEAEEANTLSFKGLSGMNSDRSYSLDKRIYNPSMFGVVASSTGFAANVGITRQATINASVEGVRGMIKTPKDVNTLNALSIHEALNPGCTVHDDPIRVAMGFIQSTKHPMRIKKAMPNLITTGMDEAIPYMTSDLFCATFKGKKGKVLDVTDRYLIYEDSDTKERKFINLSEQTMKNSDGGFYVTLKLDPKVKKGQILHNNDILAYDSTCYKKPVGLEKNTKNMAYAIGAMCKLAILPTDEGYEDSSIIDEYLSDAMSSTYVVKKEKILSKDANVYNLVQKGSAINEGDPLMVFQNAFEEEDANALLRSITDDDVEAVSDLGRIHLRSKLSGWVQDIKIYRTCELEDLSPSLRKICKAYESQIKKDKAMFAKNKIEGAKYLLEPDYKLEANGKLKKAQDSVLIEFYLKCEDKMGVGDKLIYNNSIKGVVKDIMPKGDEPRTEFRPDEPVDALLTTSAVNARMVSSIIITGAINKALVELDRKCKEMLGIKWKNLDQM